MTQLWPWPDDRLERRSRIAHMYRDALADEAPQAATALDQLMARFGQNWILEGFAVDPETLLTVRQLAEVADVGENSVRNWIYRWPLRKQGSNDNGSALYRWGDVIDHQRYKRAT